jgi:eukaryotic-like serine/threonine-protein kinase
MSELNLELDSSLRGRVIESETQTGVRYHLERVVGEGGMGTAYLARRESPSGSAPVVIKVMHAGFGGGSVTPELVAAKEAVALGRLNESVPPTPFVVRLVDSGTVRWAGRSATPWTAIEYVHGGVEGTTLEDRVTYSLHKTGYGFDVARAAHAIRCLSAGLSAIHGVGVIHRDLTPGNVLCCGFGEAEIFKIADFGVARAAGVALTFTGVNVGTIGYAAPESSEPTAGPRTDIFSFAGVVYYLLTGQHYLDAQGPADAARKISSGARPSVMDHAALSPELLARPQACRALDTVLAQATAASPALRPQTAEQFAAAVLKNLGDPHAAPHSSRRLLSAVLAAPRPSLSSEHQWIVRSRPRSDLTVKSAAWDTDGHAFVLSPGGAQFWNGQVWADASRVLANLPSGMTFTERYEAGGWLVGGESPILSVVDTRGVSSWVEAPVADVHFSLASGRIDDLLVAVGARPGQGPRLWALTGRRWMKSVPLPGVAHVSTLQRLDDSRWLLGGRTQEGAGFAAIYAPVQCELEPLKLPPLRAIIGGASAAERSVALLAGSNGVVLRIDGTTLTTSTIGGEPDLATVAVDILDREWAASLGVLWSRDLGRGEPFRPLWSDSMWRAPFVSMMADAGFVVAMTADGGIVEGRAIQVT